MSKTSCIISLKPSFFRRRLKSKIWIFLQQEVHLKNTISEPIGFSGKKSRRQNERKLIPIPSMYGLFTYIYHKNQPNVGKYYIYIYHTWMVWDMILDIPFSTEPWLWEEEELFHTSTKDQSWITRSLGCPHHLRVRTAYASGLRVLGLILKHDWKLIQQLIQSRTWRCKLWFSMGGTRSHLDTWTRKVCKTIIIIIIIGSSSSSSTTGCLPQQQQYDLLTASMQ